MHQKSPGLPPCRGRWRSLALAALLAWMPRTWAAEFTVFAATSLTDVLPALAAVYARDHADRARFSFASSSTLARQIEAGASADMFIAADDEWMDYALDKGLVLPATRRVLAGNRLVLIGAPGTPPVTLDRTLPLASLLGGGRLAVGDPAHVPAGRYAELALGKLGLWAAVRDRLAPAESVRVALMYVARGEAPLGVVYATDVRGVSAVAVLGVFPADSHPPIHYPGAVTGNAAAPAAAREFLAWLAGPAADAVWHDYGFTRRGPSSDPEGSRGAR